MQKIIKINENSITMKEYSGQRVVTLQEVDAVHNRKSGTASYNFNYNRNHFVEGVDYFKVTKESIGGNFPVTLIKGNPKFGRIVLTKSGYLMLVKTFNDTTSWNIQRALVDNFFNPDGLAEHIESRSCPKCRRVNPADANYCNKCGISLKTPEQIASEAA